MGSGEFVESLQRDGRLQEKMRKVTLPRLLEVVSADFDISTAGKGLRVREGANAKMGTAVLNGSTEVTVPTTAVTASSRVFLTVNAPGGTVGAPYVSSRSAGASFGIRSTNAADTSTVAWLIIEPG